jgi:polysaccharide transporter, PST family
VGNLVVPQWYFQALERLRDMAVIQAIAKCATAACIILVVRSPRDTWVAALIMSGPQIAGSAAALCLRRPLAPSSFYRPKGEDIIRALQHSWHMFASIASTSLYLHFNTLVLGLLCGERSVALYSVGTRLTGAVQIVASPIVQSVFPRASLLFAERPPEAWRLLKHVALFVLPLVGVACLLTGILAPQIVRIVGGRAYLDAQTVLRIMSPIPLLVTLAAGLSQAVMVNLRLTKQLFRLPP